MISNFIILPLLESLIIFFSISLIEKFRIKNNLSLNIKYWACFFYLLIVFSPKEVVNIPYLFLIVAGIIWAALNIKILILFFLTSAIFLFIKSDFIMHSFLSIFASFGMSYLIDYKVGMGGKYISYPKVFSYIFISISVVILMLSSRIFF